MSALFFDLSKACQLVHDWVGLHCKLPQYLLDCAIPLQTISGQTSDCALLQDLSSAALVRRTFQQRLNDPPILSFGALPKQARTEQLQGSGLALHFSAVSQALPLNVHLVTLKALPQDSVLLRLAHLYQVSPTPDFGTEALHFNGCSPACSGPQQGLWEEAKLRMFGVIVQCKSTLTYMWHTTPSKTGSINTYRPYMYRALCNAMQRNGFQL